MLAGAFQSMNYARVDEHSNLQRLRKRALCVGKYSRQLDYVCLESLALRLRNANTLCVTTWNLPHV